MTYGSTEITYHCFFHVNMHRATHFAGASSSLQCLEMRDVGENEMG